VITIFIFIIFIFIAIIIIVTVISARRSRAGGQVCSLLACVGVVGEESPLLNQLLEDKEVEGHAEAAC
jgi:hypothetical protein